MMHRHRVEMFSVTINSETYTVDLSDKDYSWITPTTTLNDFIRHHTVFKGTKVSCNEGGCGSCTVALTYTDLTTGKSVTRGINSCLAPLLSVNNMKVTTNEGLGDITMPNPIQKKLADLSGTQCGYCSSGMVMSLYSYLAEHPSATQAEIETMLDGNICRCTGYRPILEAFKTFASDHICDKATCCKKHGDAQIEIEEAQVSLKKVRQVTASNTMIGKIGSQPAQWIDVDREDKLQYWMNHLSNMKVMLVVGATSQALDRVTYDAYINIQNVPSLNVITQDVAGITLGAAVSFTNAIAYLTETIKSGSPSAAALGQLRKHFTRVASTLIRNRASIGGNLVYTHAHQAAENAFPSDAAIALMGIGAKITLVDATTGTATIVTVSDFFVTSLTGFYVRSIRIPWSVPNEVFRSYKIAIRQTLDHAIVNAAMKAVVDPQTNCITGSPIIAVGGIFSRPTRLKEVESALVGIDITKEQNITTLCTAFTQALSGINILPGRVAFRQNVALNYFYKFLLSLQPSLPAALQAAAEVWMTRPVTQSSQTFGTSAAEYPVSLPIPKIDGLAQTTGEAVYVADIPSPFGCVYGALITTTQANAPILSCNASAANDIPGFVAYFDASSIPESSNQWSMFGSFMCPIFATKNSLYAGQIVGCVFATSESVARQCADVIQSTLTYGPNGKIIVDVSTASKGTPFPGSYSQVSCGDTKTVTPYRTVSGNIRIQPQYHFHLENHAVLVQPTEGSLIIDLATQAASNSQASICQVTGLPASQVVVRTRRCGGAYGGKIVYPSLIACIAAIAALKLQNSTRINMTFKDAMRTFGCRPDFEMNYTVGLDKDSKIVSLISNVSSCLGVQGVENEIPTVLSNLDNCYNTHNAFFSGQCYPSTVAPSTAVRGPGWIQAIAFCEIMMNQVANETGIEPHVLRQINLYQNGDTTPNGTWIRGTPVSVLWNQMIPLYEERKKTVDAFNANSQFIKRGVSINPTRFNVSWGGPFNCLVTIFNDGSISAVHGGTEIGQGINTKVAQAIAFKFGLTEEDVVKYIKIQPTSSTICPSFGNVTGGSITSEMCAMAVMRACDTLNERLAPLRKSQQSWVELITAAVNANIELIATGYGTVQRETGGPARYNSWGCAVSEVEVDALTGQFEIKRSDLLFDCGVSMNPAIDIGQVEGGFMFGVGWFTSEIVEWDQTTGEAVMAGSWRYKPPGASDLPEILNVTLLENSNNSVGVLSSKAVGEPPLSLGVSVVLAIESAINAIRVQNGLPRFKVSKLPLTVDQIALACDIVPKNYIIPKTN